MAKMHRLCEKCRLLFKESTGCKISGCWLCASCYLGWLDYMLDAKLKARTSAIQKETILVCKPMDSNLH